MKRLNNKGNVSIILCVAIVALLGFTSYVVDIGLVYIERTELSNALDSAVLAAAMELPQNPTNARMMANKYLESNNVLVSEAVVSISSDNKTVEIDGLRSVNHLFAPIIGINSSKVNVSSSAQVGPIKTVSDGIRPFAVESFDFVYGQLVTLKAGAGDGYNGNYRAVALGGTGSSIFKANALYGYKGDISVGDYIDTETGNMAGATNAIENYIDSEQSSFNNFSRDSIRLWTIPIVDTLSVDGRKPVLVLGFAEFYVEAVVKESTQPGISGRFVKFVAKGEIDITLKDRGLYGVKLVR